MKYVPSTTWLTIGVILGTLLASGPLVQAVDFTAQPADVTDVGSAEASISIISPPAETFRITPGRFGSEPYLYAPPISASIDEVRGDPILVYEVAVRGLGYNFAELIFLSESDAGRVVNIEMQRSAVDIEDLNRETYQGVVTVRWRGEQEFRVVFQRNVTVNVEDINVD
jgi:hypothetical protein